MPVICSLLESDRLSRMAAAEIANPVNQCLISPVNHWEMAMKISVGEEFINYTGARTWAVRLGR